MLIITKWITNDAVNDAKVKLRSTQFLRSRNAANTTDLNVIRTNSTDQTEIPSALSMAGNQINNCVDPVLSQDVATKNYVDAKFSGQSPKAPVTAVYLSNLTATYANGASGVGATLTGTTNGVIPNADGITVAVNNRVLVTAQTSAFQNGIYIVTQLGSVGAPFILTRSTDANSSSSVSGFYTIAQQGSTVGDHEWLQTTPDPVVIGTTAIALVDFGTTTFSAGNGITKSGITISNKISSGLAFDGTFSTAVQVNSTTPAGTTKINGSNQIEGLKDLVDTFTLAASDITNGYVDCSQVAHTNSVSVQPNGGLPQGPGDVSLSYTGGAGGKTRITFAGDLLALLAASDVLYVRYNYL